jgi:hypothetical protein
LGKKDQIEEVNAIRIRIQSCQHRITKFRIFLDANMKAKTISSNNKASALRTGDPTHSPVFGSMASCKVKAPELNRKKMHNSMRIGTIAVRLGTKARLEIAGEKRCAGILSAWIVIESLVQRK